MPKFNPHKDKGKQKDKEKFDAKSPQPTAGISFSFKYLNIEHPKFCLNNPPDGCLRDLLEKLKNASGMPIGDLLGHYSKAMRNHKVTWSETTEPNGFDAADLNEQLRGTAAYQFSCAAGGRLVGILIDEVFFIVWADLHHRLQPMKSR